jgi:tetratricopeptide (TPR) repeat protein
LASSLFLVPSLGQKSEKASDYYNRGLQKQDSGDLEGALAAYDKALELQPRLAEAYNNRANIKLQGGTW